MRSCIRARSYEALERGSTVHMNVFLPQEILVCMDGPVAGKQILDMEAAED